DLGLGGGATKNALVAAHHPGGPTAAVLLDEFHRGQEIGVQRLIAHAPSDLLEPAIDLGLDRGAVKEGSVVGHHLAIFAFPAVGDRFGYVKEGGGDSSRFQGFQFKAYRELLLAAHHLPPFAEQLTPAS